MNSNNFSRTDSNKPRAGSRFMGVDTNGDMGFFDPGVESVAGKSGVVTLIPEDVGAAHAVHTHETSSITDATSANTSNTVVKRDASGNFVANTITANLTGNADTATKLQTTRKINNVDFDGSANITIADSTKLPLTGGTLTGNLTIAPADNAVIELGRIDGTASIPSLDFHSGAVFCNYDARIYASGGTGVSGKANLNVNAESFVVDGNLTSQKNVQGVQLKSTTTDNPPIIVSSTIQVANLNAEFLGGKRVSELTPISHVGSGGVQHALVNGVDHGFMAASDKVKIDGIATNANNYTHPSTDGTLHVPATSTVNSGKLLRAGGTAGNIYWGFINKDDVGLTSVDNTADVNKVVLSASKLTTARNINGVSFDGTSNITINAVDSTPRIAVSEKGAANGVATLDANGKVVESQIPSLALTDTSEVNSEAEMLALSTARKGDVCVRSDINKSFILAADGYSTLSNWKELRTPTDAVLSVAGKVGAVSLNKNDVGLNNVDNTADVDKVVFSSSKLTTARTINGVAFDGTSNITINAIDSTPRIAVSEKGAANGVASLDVNGKLLDSVIPDYAITSVFEANTEAEMLSLVSAKQGDICTRFDLSKTFILTNNFYDNVLNWKEFKTPVDIVLSVAGKEGHVTLTKDDVGLNNVDNTADADKPVSIQTIEALSLKQDKIIGAISNITTANLMSNVAVVTDENGKLTHLSSVTVQELGYLNGVSSNIQDQINSLSTSEHTHSLLIGDGVSDKIVFHNNERFDIVAGSNVAITYDDANNKIVISTSGELSGSVESAQKLTTARQIVLSGDATGSCIFDGSQDVNLIVDVKNDSHTHVVSNISGLESALSGKLDSSHTGSTGNAHGLATTAVNGFMSSVDKVKLNSVSSYAQKNSEITKEEIEAILIGEITTHTHPGGGGGGDYVHPSTHPLSILAQDGAKVGEAIVWDGFQWKPSPVAATSGAAYSYDYGLISEPVDFNFDYGGLS